VSQSTTSSAPATSSAISTSSGSTTSQAVTQTSSSLTSSYSTSSVFSVTPESSSSTTTEKSSSGSTSLTTFSTVETTQSLSTETSSELTGYESSTSMMLETTSTSSSAEATTTSASSSEFSTSSATETAASSTSQSTESDIISTQTSSSDVTTSMSSSSSFSSTVSSSSASSSISASPVPSLCPGSNLTTYTSANDRDYEIYCDMYSPGSYRTSRVANFVACIDACDADGACSAVGFHEGICYFSLPPVRLRFISGYQVAARPGAVQTGAATSSTATSTTGGGGVEQPTPSSSSAPCNNGEILDGANGRQYTISCASDTSGNGGAYTTTTFPSGDFTQCITICDLDPQCGAWVWGGPGGPGEVGGTCFLKQAPQSPVPGRGNFVAGILIGSEGPSPVSSSTSSSTTQDSTSSSSATSTQLPDPAPCPEVNGTPFYDSEGLRYTIYCGVNTQPSLFNSEAFPTFRGCIEACRQQSQFCGAVGYIGGRCYFKPPPEIFSAEGGVQLAVRALDDASSSSSSSSLAPSSTMESSSEVSISSTEMMTTS
jgi:hypothetical protein